MTNKSQSVRVPNHALRYARKSRGLSQRELAEQLGIPDKFLVAKWEGGKHAPGPEYRGKLCEFFNKSPEELGFLPSSPPLSNLPASPSENGQADLTSHPLSGSSQTTREKASSSPIKNRVIVLSTILLLSLIVAGLLGVLTRARAATYTNPVLNAPFPDPDVIFANGRYYAYATGSNGRNTLHLQVSWSSDLIDWKPPIEALPTLPSWASFNTTTAEAPSVIQIGGIYTMYYSVPDTQYSVLYPQQHYTWCIGVATSKNPEGPFSDTSGSPLTCQNDVMPTIPCETKPNQLNPDLGGTLDPAPFIDGGNVYLYYKNDGNNVGCPTAIWGQKLSSNGKTFVPGSRATSLITSTSSWEGSIVEAPFMFVHERQYYLFFSGNNYTPNASGWSSEAEGYARCSSPLGPCTQVPDPILRSIPNQVIGPGSASLIQVDSQTWMVYQSWTTENEGLVRTMNIDHVAWVRGEPVVFPTTTPPSVPLASQYTPSSFILDPSPYG